MTNVRSEIPEKYKWNLEAIYPDIAAFEADFAATGEMIKAFRAHQSSMSGSARALYRALSDAQTVIRRLRKLYEYAMLNAEVDTSDNRFIALQGRTALLIDEFSSASYFAEPELIRLPAEKLNEWFGSFPKLGEFRRFIESARRYAPYTLSDECEKLLADLRSGIDLHGSSYHLFINSDLRFGKIRGSDGKLFELTDTGYVPLMMGSDRRVRRAAFTRLYEVYGKFGNTIAAMLNGYVREMSVLAKIRGFSGGQEAAAFRDEVTPAICRNLVETVGRNLEPLYRYYELKRRALGVPKLHLYDVSAPLEASSDRKYGYEEAVELVLDTVKVYGDDYHDTLEKGLKQDGWADVYPNTGKRGGAFSAGSYDTMPYILLNYTDTLDDVFTLAHEAGHSMHSHYSNKANPSQNARYTALTAEVASTVNELLLVHRMLRESGSDDEKMYILNQLMETYKGTLFRQVMFAEFEQTFYALSEAGHPLTKELLCKTYYGLVTRYFGKDVVCDRLIENEWMRIPHFYLDFYIYKYATSISAASAIVKRIETEGKPYIEKYLHFLSVGGSLDPIDSLKLCDIDLTDPGVIEDAIADFDSAIRQYEELYAKKHPD